MLLIKAAKFMIFIYILFIISYVELILSGSFGKLQSSLLTVKPKIRNGETPGETWEIPEETGETIGET